MHSFIELTVLKPIFDHGWLWASRRFKAKLNNQLYCRNSYVDGTFYPLKSDIDTTLFLDSTEAFRSHYILYSQLKNVFPYLGECNYYCPQTLSLIETYFDNFLEIQRDPELLKRLNLSKNDISRSECAAFLVYSAINDIKNLNRNDSRRERKWLKHFDLAYNCLNQPWRPFVFKSTNLLNEVTLGISRILTKNSNDYFNIQSALEVGLRSIDRKDRKDIFNENQPLQGHLISLFPEFFYESLNKTLKLTEEQSFNLIAHLKLACLCLIRSEHFYNNPDMSKLRLVSFLNLLKKLELAPAANPLRDNLILGLQKSLFVCGFKEKHIIKSDSMNPVLKISDEICIKKLSDLSLLHRFDLIVFKKNNLLISHYVWRNQINWHNTLITRSLKNPFFDEEPIAPDEVLGQVLGVKISALRRLWVLTKCFITRRI